jgi:hypothetical protein
MLQLQRPAQASDLVWRLVDGLDVFSHRLQQAFQQRRQLEALTGRQPLEACHETAAFDEGAITQGVCGPLGQAE